MIATNMIISITAQHQNQWWAKGDLKQLFVEVLLHDAGPILITTKLFAKIMAILTCIRAAVVTNTVA